MLLTLDIGNTSTTIGLFDGSELVETWSIASEKHRSEDEIGILLINLLKIHNYENSVDAACLCSVVVCLTERYKNALKRYLKIEPFVVSNKTTNLLNYCVDYPEEVGADRIVNAFAAYSMFKKTCIVVDMGTATSFDVVRSNGDFLGGIICAGMKIQAESLKKFTSKMYYKVLQAFTRIEIQKDTGIPIHKTTLIQSMTFFLVLERSFFVKASVICGIMAAVKPGARIIGIAVILTPT